MFAVIVSLLILAAGVGALYLLLKNMSEVGIDIAAPGSCKRGRCGPSCAPAEEAGEAPLQAADEGEPGQAKA